MLRIHFTTEGLARTRLGRPSPLCDTVRSVRTLSARSRARHHVWPHKVPAERAASQLRTLLPLVPSTGYCPDFLTPPGTTGDIDADIEAVLSTRPARINAELEVLASRRPLPSWTRDLARGDSGALRRLGDALRGYHRLVVAPLSRAQQARVDADRAVRTRALADGGVGRLLSSFGPGMRWKSPVLEVDTTFHADLHVDERGLVIVPSLFGEGNTLIADDERAPVLGYHLGRDEPGRDAASDGDLDAAVDAVLGATRAAVLRAAFVGGSTSEIARRLGVSPASVSQHASALRDAGLLATRRVGQAVLHVATTRGRILLGREDTGEIPGTVARPSPASA
ncbi:MAG TPA: winged helix-turn-helix domain-containing protein [Micromonosporaceae bacterium]